MVFIHDTRTALEATVALVNTHPDTDRDALDGLTTLADLDAFLSDHPYTGDIRRDDAELQGLRAIRPRLLALWATDREGAVPLVNAMLRDGSALPQLVIHDGYDWHIHATHDDAPLATRVLVESAMAFVDVIRSDHYDRVRICDADDCSGAYIDYSRNGSKRYCDSGNCGNRMNVNAYRRRRGRQETA
ncbi:MAG TPA: CGNR zinc finger domain-containing protein [Microbacterium sp.]|uniref:CGNR zinc finger domain-containing protein n=1 Tax=Microbacterium sp. TaxID=51671 RepID=UPI002BE40F24|nr:CGNR zinc finger domain-containing protein [Microbacterium sp.]HWI30903.1 CGNR zinc finger domain-containing protein [Microbacterium sp.]